MPEAAPYALCLGYRIRYVLDLNAREAMHLCELRSGREGHPTYRAVAQAMHRLGVLVGEQPTALLPDLREPTALPALPQVVALSAHRATRIYPAEALRYQ